MVAEKNIHLKLHPDMEGIPNLEVVKLLTSLTSRELVTERFAWKHYYWFLNDEGIEYAPPPPQTLTQTPAQPRSAGSLCVCCCCAQCSWHAEWGTTTAHTLMLAHLHQCCAIILPRRGADIPPPPNSTVSPRSCFDALSYSLPLFAPPFLGTSVNTSTFLLIWFLTRSRRPRPGLLRPPAADPLRVSDEAPATAAVTATVAAATAATVAVAAASDAAADSGAAATGRHPKRSIR